MRGGEGNEKYREIQEGVKGVKGEMDGRKDK
jgi:hypothetical protein